MVNNYKRILLCALCQLDDLLAEREYDGVSLTDIKRADIETLINLLESDKLGSVL